MTVEVFRDLSPLLNPRSIAVVGASERPGSAGRLVMENLIQLGYKGKLYPVHPKQTTVMGYTCYANLEAIPEPVDMMAVLIGADKVMDTLQNGVNHGVKAAWVLASGFAESGPEGKVRQQELIQFADQTGMLVCGPNCVGVANLLDGSATYSVALSPRMRAGSVSAVMQSGAICMGLANSARFGFRYLISIGNAAILDGSDYIGYLVNDPQTKVIVAFLEGIRNPRKFEAAAKAAAEAGKPLLVVKAGRSEKAQKAVQAHTGSLAGSDVVLDAVFRRYGVVRLNDLDELVEAAELFSHCPLPKKNGIGMLSLSGGQIGLVADVAQGMKLNFPELSQKAVDGLKAVLPPYNSIENPLDAWGSGDLENTYPGCVEVLAREENIGLIALTRDTPPGVAAREVEQSMRIAEAAIKAKEKTGKPTLLFSTISAGFEQKVVDELRQHDIPYLQGTAETLRAIEAFEQYATFRNTATGKEKAGCPSPATLETWRKRLLNKKGKALDELEARQLLADYGIQGPKEKAAQTVEEAVKIAKEIGFPVVLKILSPDILHKTEIGGVKVGLKSAEEVRTAYAEVMAAAKKHSPNAHIEGVLLQEMIPAGTPEVILGVVRDADYGPTIVFGSGGVLVELIKDSSLRLPPLTRTEARAMIAETRGEKLLLGFRGRSKADIDALVDAMVRLSQLAVDFKDEIAALEMNPIMVLLDGTGIRAVDSLVEICA
jgi:acetate---CoA ligase (ADP-forming)